MEGVHLHYYSTKSNSLAGNESSLPIIALAFHSLEYGDSASRPGGTLSRL